MKVQRIWIEVGISGRRRKCAAYPRPPSVSFLPDDGTRARTRYSSCCRGHRTRRATRATIAFSALQVRLGDVPISMGALRHCFPSICLLPSDSPPGWSLPANPRTLSGQMRAPSCTTFLSWPYIALCSSPLTLGTARDLADVHTAAVSVPVGAVFRFCINQPQTVFDVSSNSRGAIILQSSFYSRHACYNGLCVPRVLPEGDSKMAATYCATQYGAYIFSPSDYRVQHGLNPSRKASMSDLGELDAVDVPAGFKTATSMNSGSAELPPPPPRFRP
jgi:hypothetical protein